MKPINQKVTMALPPIGLLLIITAFILQRFAVNTFAISFIGGVGSAWIGFGIFGLVIKRLKAEHMRKQEIAQKDERNMQIREKSGLVSYMVTLFTLVILEFVFLLMDNQFACILTIGVMSIQIASFFIALHYFNKKI